MIIKTIMSAVDFAVCPAIRADHAARSAAMGWKHPQPGSQTHCQRTRGASCQNPVETQHGDPNGSRLGPAVSAAAAFPILHCLELIIGCRTLFGQWTRMEQKQQNYGGDLLLDLNCGVTCKRKKRVRIYNRKTLKHQWN